jgi:hypothetical protein
MPRFVQSSNWQRKRTRSTRKRRRAQRAQSTRTATSARRRGGASLRAASTQQVAHSVALREHGPPRARALCKGHTRRT